MTKKKTTTANPRYLKVLDASSWEQFEKECRRVWEDAHIPKRLGRPTNMRIIWKTLCTGLEKEEITPSTSLNKLVLFGKSRHGTYPHEETIRKYAKAWKILQKCPIHVISEGDSIWLEKQAPDAWEFFQARHKEQKYWYDQELVTLEKEKKNLGKQDLTHLDKRTKDWVKDRLRRTHKEITDLNKWWNGLGVSKFLIQVYGRNLFVPRINPYI